MQKVHFRLTFVAHKCFSLSSLLTKKPLNAKGILINAASLFENAFLILVKSPPNMYPPPPPSPPLHLEALLKPIMKMHKPRAYKCQFTFMVPKRKCLTFSSLFNTVFTERPCFRELVNICFLIQCFGLYVVCPIE